MTSANRSPADHIHVLPGDGMSGDTTWFTERQTDFEQQIIRRQVAFRRARWPGLPNGRFSKKPEHTYPHILPHTEELAFFEGFAGEALAYMKDSDIAIHTEALNLKSSQVACINFFYPLRKDPVFAADVLREFRDSGGVSVFPGIEKVSGVEFEYTGQDETNRKNQPCTDWLGEPKSGKRGQHRTSIDAAVFWEDADRKSHITLIEWKYTEHNFGLCSAFEKADTKTKARCRALNVLDSPAANCLLAGPGRHCGRHYWKIMAESGISLKALGAVSGCPFQGPFYQLMRQFLVAQFLRNQPAACSIDVLAVEFEGNTSLRAVPQQLRPLCKKPDDTVIDAWNGVLDGVPRLRVVTAERLLAAYDATGHGDSAWRQYICDRYGL